MRRKWLLSLVPCLASLAGVAVEEAPTYTLGTPHAPYLSNATNAADVTAWARANASVSPQALAYVKSGGTRDAAQTGTDLSATRWYAKTAAGGFPFERNRPEYYLGDVLAVPENVDWERTYEVFQTLPDRGNFLFDTVNCRVYVILGETSKFKWVVGNAGVFQTNEINVVAVPVSAERPKNIFWTDDGMGGSPVDLSGKFVRLFGPSNLLTKVEGGKPSGVSVGGVVSSNSVVTSGVYVNVQATANSLYAAGRLDGNFVLVYYDSSDYSKIVDVVTVRVSQQKVNTLYAFVGDELKPDGQGYSGAGLLPTPLSSALEDAKGDSRGPYLYQHRGQYSYSPKNKSVFALRPTDIDTRNQTRTTWYETDNQGVQWPYEVDEYMISWPSNMPVIVRGDVTNTPGLGVAIPDVYTAELQKFQDDGTEAMTASSHARAPADGYFTPVGAGRSLLKLTGDDNIWFLPFRSVLRTDTKWYDPEIVIDVPVGQEIGLRGGLVKGLADGKTLEVEADIPGYIYAPASSPVWNAGIYSDTGVLADGVTSSVYAVTAPMDAAKTNLVEVWWSSSYRRDDMPAALAVPTLPQRSRIVWPEETEAPTIALASQEGSSNFAFWEQGKALVFGAPTASVTLPSRAYFSSDGGSILFWTRDYPTAGKAYQDGVCSLLTLGDTNGVPIVTVDYDATKGFLVDVDGMKLQSANVVAKPGEWNLFRLAWTNDAITCSVFSDRNWGDVVETFAKSNITVDVEKLACCLSGCSLGARSDARKTWLFREIDQLVFLRRFVGDEEAQLLEMTDRVLAEDVDTTLVCTFDDPDELETDGSTDDLRLVRDHKLGIAWQAADCLCDDKGAPLYGSCVIASVTAPVVYRQTDPNACGYNPNEEHAFVEAGQGGYVVWALRCDLNQTIASKAPASRPGALVSYVQDGKAKMQYFHVAVTNAIYDTFGAGCTVGRQLPGPHPFDLFENPWLEETKWDSKAVPPFRDRKGQVWARAPGEFDIKMFYAQQSGFDWPAGLTAPKTGEAVPWLAYADVTSMPTTVLNEPKPWHWSVTWPTNGVPTMKIGYTLTTSAYGLPEVWNAKSMAVLYPVSNATRVVELTDPTVARRQSLGFKVSTGLANAGLQTGPGEKLLEKTGFYYFQGITATLSDRLYIDPSTDELVLIGKKENKTAGVNLLFPNVLTTNEVKSVKALLTTPGEETTKLEQALEALGKLDVVRPTTVSSGHSKGGHLEYVDTYEAPDHYALTATGTGASGATNWVVLIENNATNSFCDEGNPINMHLLKVVPEYYAGSVATREDPNNLLSQILSVHYSQNFCGAAKDFEFEWQRAAPSTMDWKDGRLGAGLTSFSVGEQGDTLANMVNTYWRCRYRAVTNTSAYATMGGQWSDWSDQGLAEGWVQRCLNNVTPFTQRMTDLYENEAETAVTMMRQAGKPYAGDVALNQDNLTSVGLVELYRTILNKAETMSLLQGIDDAEANKQLLLAVERLADLYNVLGDEAYADAINPTIGFGSSFTEIEPGLEIDYGAASSSLFCFDNQVSSLLDEELALVRGRDCLDNPSGHNAPYYNRLIWNFTKGITAGEVAYAVNYGISGHRASTITAQTAADQYPQGHGDAFGHYLSALQGYYRLLRNPYFSWGEPAMGEMNVADSVVNVDYYDESTFASSAANVAKAAQKAVELTALKTWRDNNSETVGAGYVDANATNAFGYGEWASRGAYGAFCNWAVANSLLPEAKATDDDGVPYADKGLTRIDRSTVPGIAALSEAVAAIERTCDRMDAGKNPLGLDANAVPFDLTPIGDAQDATHFEQIRARAGQAFENARKVLDRAQTYANRLKLIQETEAGAIDNLDEMEDDACADLIAIYGRPYTQDVGPSGTYAQGYDGPDTYHYMWTDLSKYGLTSVEDTLVVTTVCYTVVVTNNVGAYVKSDRKKGANEAVSFSLSANGLVQRPADVTGERPTSGQLQQAYADFLTAYVAVRNACRALTRSYNRMVSTESLVLQKLSALQSRQKDIAGKYDKLVSYAKSLEAARIATASFQAIMDNCQVTVDSTGAVTGNLGLSSTILADGMKKAIGIGVGITYFVASLGALSSTITEAAYQKKIDVNNVQIQKAENAYDKSCVEIEGWSDMIAAVDDHAAAVAAVTEAFAALNAAQEPITKLVQDARAIEEGRELTRQQYANNIAKLRYNDMFFRKMRNAALAQYDAAFALAQKYTLLAAKAYAYETGSPLESTEEGRALLRTIVGARALGEVDDDGKPMVAENGDAGLSGVLAKLDANWANRKTQLGIGNPQPYATWFSLRHGLFRILSDSLGDDAWAKELAKYWVEDIRTDPEFARSCQPFASQFGLAEKEPGLIIPFETTIDFAYNLFGKPLAFDDAQFDSTWYATKISKAGVWFSGYNEKRAGYTGASAFATTPNVYLVPVGTDRMRVPGTDANDAIVGFDVVDQTIPAPYPLTAAEIAEANWLPTYSGETAGVDAETRIRRHPSFRAYFGNRDDTPTDAALDAVRLTGRSVWNTRWLLVIPAGALNADRDQALRSFIYGLDTDRDGIIDVKPVSDIKIGFKTYAQSGK